MHDVPVQDGLSARDLRAAAARPRPPRQGRLRAREARAAWTRAEVMAVQAKLRLTFRRRGGVVGEAQQGRGPVMMFRLF